jgi:hypothetical protein
MVLNARACPPISGYRLRVVGFPRLAASRRESLRTATSMGTSSIIHYLGWKRSRLPQGIARGRDSSLMWCPSTALNRADSKAEKEQQIPSILRVARNSFRVRSSLGGAPRNDFGMTKSKIAINLPDDQIARVHREVRVGEQVRFRVTLPGCWPSRRDTSLCGNCYGT